MKARSVQLALAITSMATIGAVYGWSSTADVLMGLSGLSAKNVELIFVTLTIGIGIGVAISGVLLTHLPYPRPIAAGLVLWGLADLLLAQSKFQSGSGRSAWCLALLGGIGVGIAYLALINFFRNLFEKPTVLGGLIGPLGFAAGSGVLCIAQTVHPGLDRAIEVYRFLGIAALVLAVVVLLGLAAAPYSAPRLKNSRREAREDLLFFFALLSLNVAPGMGIVCVAVPWFRHVHSWPFQLAAWVFCAVLIALPLGQAIGALGAKRWGNQKVFQAMFFIRFVLFLAAAFFPQSIWPWILAAVSLACHGSGFGLLPKIVTSSRLGADSRMLGLVLSGWGVGGAVGVAAIRLTLNSGSSQTGYALIAGLMLMGVLLSTRLPTSETRP